MTRAMQIYNYYVIRNVANIASVYKSRFVSYRTKYSQAPS